MEKVELKDIWLELEDAQHELHEGKIIIELMKDVILI
jgi:hypothetical protein